MSLNAYSQTNENILIDNIRTIVRYDLDRYAGLIAKCTGKGKENTVNVTYLRETVMISFNSDEYIEKIVKSKEKDLESLNDEIAKISFPEPISAVNITIKQITSGESSTENARTFYFKTKVCGFIADGKSSIVENFDIIIPSKESNIKVVERDKNKKLSKNCIRFLVGHELGHLWLHLDKVRETMDKGAGTRTLDKKLEPDADCFSFQISELRDKHLKEYVNDLPR